MVGGVILNMYVVDGLGFGTVRVLLKALVRWLLPWGQLWNESEIVGKDL